MSYKAMRFLLLGGWAVAVLLLIAGAAIGQPFPSTSWQTGPSNCVANPDWIEMRDEGKLGAVLTYHNSVDTCSGMISRSKKYTAPNGITAGVMIEITGGAETITVMPDQPFVALDGVRAVPDGDTVEIFISGPAM